MSITTLFTSSAPSLGGVSFDAVLEYSTEKSITLTQYPVEFGANINDHRILNPDRYYLVGAISNNPLGFGLDDIANIGVGAAGTLIGGVAGAAVSAVGSFLSASFLSGSSGTRSASAWELLSNLMTSGEPFEVVSGLETLRDMVVINISQRTTPESEQGLIFIAELRQVQIVFTQLVQTGVASSGQLSKTDRSATQAAPDVQKGQVSTAEATGPDYAAKQKKLAELGIESEILVTP